MNDTEDTANSVRSDEEERLYSASKPMQPFTQVQAKPRVILPPRSSAAPSNRTELPRSSSRADVAVTTLPFSHTPQIDPSAPARHYIQPLVQPGAQRTSPPPISLPTTATAVSQRIEPQISQLQSDLPERGPVSREIPAPIQSEARRSLPQPAPSDSRSVVQSIPPAPPRAPAARADRTEYRFSSPDERNNRVVERGVNTPRQSASDTNRLLDPDLLREAEQRLERASQKQSATSRAPVETSPPFSIAHQESQDRANQNQELHDVVLRQKITGELRQEFKEREQIAEEKQVTLLRQTLATSMDRFLNS